VPLDRPLAIGAEAAQYDGARRELDPGRVA
jgi:hypothetical protein